MQEVAISFEDQPGCLATMGEVVGRAGLNLEGGGCFVENGRGVARFLFADRSAARDALEAAGIQVGVYRMCLCSD
ncbi:hypothetical protein [Acanthopleuribacter pedis]|uniref:ACT domain-containing protein n=1 Tax=Acanthopleuribacter pedis TaxID=442870 RepID=A0A8J7QAU9_9BACT|nr:hypothetical protein [Acanthopleuribacter pedis]MBO1320239.1 hypothetical protein [Acanthopleuribacter pedis]